MDMLSSFPQSDQMWTQLLDAAIRTAQAIHGEQEGLQRVLTRVGVALYGNHEVNPIPVLVYRKASINPALSQAVLDRDDRRCRQCGARDHLSIDHIIPESKGGTTTIDNLATLCRRCNSRKGARYRVANTADPARWYRKSEIAAALGVDVRTVTRMVDRGDIEKDATVPPLFRLR